MVLLEKLWDDVVAGPQPERGLGKLRKLSTKPLNIKGTYLHPHIEDLAVHIYACIYVMDGCVWFWFVKVLSFGMGGFF